MSPERTLLHAILRNQRHVSSRIEISFVYIISFFIREGWIIPRLARDRRNNSNRSHNPSQFTTFRSDRNQREKLGAMNSYRCNRDLSLSVLAGYMHRIYSPRCTDFSNVSVGRKRLRYLPVWHVRGSGSLAFDLHAGDSSVDA